jgi:hypothetical protein
VRPQDDADGDDKLLLSLLKIKKSTPISCAVDLSTVELKRDVL